MFFSFYLLTVLKTKGRRFLSPLRHHAYVVEDMLNLSAICTPATGLTGMS
jgi:hypothetical protein